MVGFSNLHFDYPIIHDLMVNPHTFDYNKGYQLAMQIIKTDRAFDIIRPADRYIPQVDLFKINHFDNANKRTTLKAIQFAMRAESVEDLPIEVGTNLTPEQMDQLIHYNIHDVTETERFLEKNLHLIDLRKELYNDGVLTGDVLNFSDTKIGEQYLIKKIGRAKCYTGSKARQTFRESVNFKDVVLPKISYRTEEYEKVVEWFKNQIVYTTGGELPKLEVKLAGLDFFFGVGGVHASVESKYFESNETHVILDVDVSGMYPAIATVNNFAPEHLADCFVEPYKQLQTDRNQYKKGTAKNAMFKLAQNSVFGKSDNVFSCFYDPKFPKQITVNGQLQLLQLVEMFDLIPGVQIIQANTDGVTAYLPRSMQYLFNLWKDIWQTETGLKLEEVEYSKMWIRDVNNYLCLKTNGEVKRKGAYWYPIEPKDYDGVWNKDFSMLVVQRATEQCLVQGWSPEVAVKLITDKFDFMKRYKTPGGANVYIGTEKMQKTVRYYVSKSGHHMKKIATPKGKIGDFKRANGLTDSFYDKIKSEIPEGTWDARIHTKNKSRYEAVTTSIESGRLVKACNQVKDFNWNDVDWEYYIEEIKKLLIGV